LKIILKNNLRLTQIPSELSERLTELLKFANPKWLENDRMGRWNKGVPNVLKFYDKVGKGGLWIPRGYMGGLIRLCRKMNVPYEIEDKRRLLPEVAYPFCGKLKPFQEHAVNVMLKRDFGTLSSPTGSGKTVMALYMISLRKQPVMIVVHSKDLAVQWMERVEEFLNIPITDIGFIGGGKHKMGKAVTLALVQSLYKNVEEAAPHVGFLVVDECHRCPSRTFTEAVVGFDSRFMLGLSATPWRRDNLSNLIFWHLGDVHHEVDRGELIRSGDVLSARVIVRETAFVPFHDPVMEYSRMLSELTGNDERNRLIAADVAKEASQGEGICLVLSDRKIQCSLIWSILTYKHGIAARLLTGDMPLAERQTIIEEMDKGKLKIVIATGQLIGEGFDNRNLSSLFLATPVKFNGRVLQYIGRVLRPAPGKKQATIYDYVDVKVDVLRASAAVRRKVYDDISCVN
jgi:superfamily II DNA or RNA helicase